MSRLPAPQRTPCDRIKTQQTLSVKYACKAVRMANHDEHELQTRSVIVAVHACTAIVLVTCGSPMQVQSQ